MRNIGTDVGKKKFIVCVMDDKEKILEETTSEVENVLRKQVFCA